VTLTCISVFSVSFDQYVTGGTQRLHILDSLC
jgi:hypothetical protein